MNQFELQPRENMPDDKNIAAAPAVQKIEGLRAPKVEPGHFVVKDYSNEFRILKLLEEAVDPNTPTPLDLTDPYDQKLFDESLKGINARMKKGGIRTYEERYTPDVYGNAEEILNASDSAVVAALNEKVRAINILLGSKEWTVDDFADQKSLETLRNVYELGKEVEQLIASKREVQQAI